MAGQRNMTTGVSQQPKIFTQLVGVKDTSMFCSHQKVMYTLMMTIYNGGLFGKQAVVNRNAIIFSVVFISQ
jgi:hypothetical protein